MNIGIFFLFANSAHATHSNFDLLNLSERVSGLADAYLKISLEQAWGKINTPPQSLTTVVIGIFDSGTDTTHPEFTGVRLGTTPPDAKIDSDPDGHGTEVAGIIGANNVSFPISTNYQFPQMNGVLSGAHNLNYRLEIRKSERLSFFKTIKKLNELTDSGAQVVNLSISGFRITSFALDTYFSLKFLANPHVLFILAAGNDDHDANANTPANLGNLPNVLTVAATNLDDSRVPASNFGSAVGIAAPGDRVYAPRPLQSTLPLDAGDYDPNFSDTSAAAPLVTGVAGLIKAIKPALTPAEIKTILTKTGNTDPVITDPDKLIGRRLNALKAVCDPQVLNCDIVTPPASPILFATDFVEFVNDNTTAGEIKANNTLYFGTNNVHYGDVTTTMLLSYGSNSRIIGNVGYNQLSLYPSPFPPAVISTPPAITGIVTTPIPPPHVVLPIIPLFPVATTAITVTEDMTLPPGNYGNILVTNGATLTLLNGIYNVDTLLYFNPDTSLRFTVGTVMNVNGAFFASARVRVLPIIEGSSARLPITAGNIMLIQGNTVSADLLASCCVLMVNDNVVQGSMRGGFIDGNFRNRINAPSLPTVSALRVMSPSYPTRTTTPLDTLNWMEENTMSALVHTNMATTTRMKIKGEFQKARAVLKNN